mgnify:CR=1 FL=1
MKVRGKVRRAPGDSELSALWSVWGDACPVAGRARSSTCRQTSSVPYSLAECASGKGWFCWSEVLFSTVMGKLYGRGGGSGHRKPEPHPRRALLRDLLGQADVRVLSQDSCEAITGPALRVHLLHEEPQGEWKQSASTHMLPHTYWLG